MIAVRPCLSPRGCRRLAENRVVELLAPLVPSPGTWSDAELETLRRFAGLVRSGAVSRRRAREWRTLLDGLQFVLERATDPMCADVCRRAEPHLRMGLFEIATAELAELDGGRR